MLSASRLSFITQTETPEDSLSIISAHDPVNFATKSSLSTPGDTTRKHLSVIVLLHVLSCHRGQRRGYFAHRAAAALRATSRRRSGVWLAARALALFARPPGRWHGTTSWNAALSWWHRCIVRPSKDLWQARPALLAAPREQGRLLPQIICTRTRELQGRSPPCAPWYGRAAIW